MTYTSNTKYVDIDTGEQLTRGRPNDYITIKTKRHVTTNYQQGKCHIEYTKLVRRNPQTKLNFSDNG